MGFIDWVKDLGKVTLYYPGCLTKNISKKEFDNYKEIFNLLGLDFVILPESVCCGMPVLNAGASLECKRLAIKNFEIFKKRRVKKIVTNCPSCYHMFNEIYPKLVEGWDIGVEHASVTILRLLENRKIDFSEQLEVSLSYHDPCHLGRYSGIYEEPREVLRRLGGRVIELDHNREKAVCCGGGGGLRANFKKDAKDIADLRLKELPNISEKLISPCPLCYLNLSSSKEGQIKSEEFSEFVLRRLKKYGFK